METNKEDIITTIKELSHKISEDYLLLDKDMNESIVDLYNAGEIENDEILKRICEHANQNVYLALFYDPAVDRSNIKFDMADFQKIKSTLNQSENDMKAYDTPPADFRDVPNAIPEDLDNAISLVVGSEKTASINMLVEKRASLNHLLSKVETLRNSEVGAVEDAFNKIATDTKVMVVNGESIGDIAKVAMTHVKNLELGNMTKIATVYDIIHKELINEGYHVSTEFTKVSSLKPNSNSAVLKPVENMAMSLAKIAGFDEMLINMRSAIADLNEKIKKSF